MDPEYQNRKKFNLWRKVIRFYRGLKFTFKNDLSVALQLIVSAVTLVISLFLRNSVDVILILMATGFMLAMELVNTSIEELSDFVQSEYDEKIKIIKDVAATAVGIAIIVWVAVILREYYEFWSEGLLWFF